MKTEFHYDFHWQMMLAYIICGIIGAIMLYKIKKGDDL